MAEYITAATLFWSAGEALESAISTFLTAHTFINKLKSECKQARTELEILRTKVELYHSSLSKNERTTLSNAINAFQDQCDEYDGTISNLLEELGKFDIEEHDTTAKSLRLVARRATWKVAVNKRRFVEFKDDLEARRTRIDRIFKHLMTDHGRRPSLPETEKECQQDLFKAISAGTKEWVQQLLDNGANATASFLDNDQQETTKSPIHKATELGRLGIVKLLREYGAELNALDPEQATPLIVALKTKRLDMAKYFINAYIAEQRANPSFNVARSINLADSSGNHALAYLIKLRLEPVGETKDWTEILKSLLELGADPITKTDFSHSPLHYCAANNLVEELELLANVSCSLGGGRLDTTVRLEYRDDILGATPLWLAARNGHLASVKVLSERGADHSLVCNASSTLPTPLWACYAAGSLETFTYLLSKPGTDPNFKNAKGLGILHALVLKYANSPTQFERWLEPLLAHPETDPNIQDATQDATDEQSTGLTPLHYATREAKLPIVQLLLHSPRCRDKITSINIDVTRGDDSKTLQPQNKHTFINIDINAPDEEPRNPEHQDRHTSINIDILKAQYGDLEAPSSKTFPKSPSSSPSSSRNKTSPGSNPIPVNINAPDSEGKTPLMTSISLYNPQPPQARSSSSLILGIPSPHHLITTYLLQQGALLTPLDVNGYDAFFWACAVGDILSAACLLAQPGRDTHRQLNRQTAAKGMTPLHVAAKAGKSDMVRWLLAMGADKGLKCTKPFEGCSMVGTAAEVAREGGGNEVVQVLERF